ncbi:MAG TPA: branched-chain amino acid ABC transporter permease [Methylomirabilota bacterium]|nr:branched-chain amino acid ABC transporter permease [Methylomirabilota bacterium]
MTFLTALLIDGALTGAIYALIALSFVIVYKASRMINFAVGECVTLGSRLVAVGLHGFGLGLAGSVVVGCAGMIAVMVAFNEIVLRRLAGRPVIALIMITIGLATFIRGAMPLLFAGVPAAILPTPPDAVLVAGVPVAAEKVMAALVASFCIAALTALLRRSRIGIALRAIADDQQGAMAIGVDLHRYFGLTWALVGVLSVVGGTLWTVVAGGGFGMALVGLKIFPIVIIGGLDSVGGTIVGAMLVGVLESLAAGYVDPVVGGGFSNIASYLVLVAVLFVRPYGLFGGPDARRV